MLLMTRTLYLSGWYADMVAEGSTFVRYILCTVTNLGR